MIDAPDFGIERLQINVTRMESAHLRKTWCSCWANEAKRAASASTSPPSTAVSRVDFLRQSATTSGAHSHEPLS